MRLETPVSLVSSLALLLGAAGAAGQGTFQNLGFESATLVPVPGQSPFYYFAQAFPGWTGYIGGVQDGLTWYNGVTIASAGFSIIDRSYSIPPGTPGGVIQGNYTAVLISGVSGTLQMYDTTLEQSSLVPVTAESLQFKAFFDPSGGTGSYFSVSLGGQTLALVTLGAGTNYTLYGADIHDWAGQTAELAFTCHTNFQWSYPADLYLDSIQFSTEPIPEPGVFALLALGVSVVGWGVLRRRP
jgi:hypothetical protein